METAEKPGELKGFEKLHKKAIFYLFEELEALFEQSELKWGIFQTSNSIQTLRWKITLNYNNK